MGRPDLKVIDGQGELQESVAVLPEDYVNIEKEIRTQRRIIAGLRSELTKLRATDPRADEIYETMSYWADKLHPKAKIPLDSPRAVKVKERLDEGYTVEQLKTVVDITAQYRWMGEFGVRYCEPGPGREARDELTLIMRDTVHVEALLKLAKQEADNGSDHEDYRRWLYAACLENPGLLGWLAFLAEREPHGCVIANAAIWAKVRQASDSPAIVRASEWEVSGGSVG